jgi:Lrp/AsnC family leucine-responsive transcriptional regulator
MNKIDLIDKKILYELDSDARKSCREIGKKLRLSPEVVNYRIKKLEESKIIAAYTLAINLSKLGVIQFKILLAFQHITSNKLEKIIVKLKENKYVKWIVSSKGNWDMIISLEAFSLKEVELIKNSVLSYFEDFVSRKSMAICTEASTFNRSYFKENSQKNERCLVDSEKESDLDEVDIEIIKKLSSNSRKSFVDIATELKTTARIIHYRVKQLVKNKIITGFRLAIDYPKLEIQFYKLLVYLENPDKERIIEYINYLKNQNNLIHYVRVIGNWDFEPEFEVYSEQEFNKILNEMKDKFSDLIKNIEIITISKEHKFVYF